MNKEPIEVNLITVFHKKNILKMIFFWLESKFIILYLYYSSKNMKSK